VQAVDLSAPITHGAVVSSGSGAAGCRRRRRPPWRA
jgi:hypothetical protein